MPQRPRIASGFPAQWPLYAMIVYIAVCFVLGGTSRLDVPQHALLRPLAIVLAVCLVCFAPRIDWRAIRWPGGLLLALAALMLIQLVPLPNSWWTALPGRDAPRAALALIGRDGATHGVSLTPDLTLNSLFALVVPAAALLGMASLRTHERRIILVCLVVAIIANMLFGFLQLVQGRFYLYEITNLGSAVGFFANRNHNAALIAASFPLLACMATWPVRKAASRSVLWLVAGGFMILALLAILSIGSRWGLALAALGLVWALLVARHELMGTLRKQTGPMRMAIFAALTALIFALLVIAALGSRDEAVRRLFDVALTADTRAQTLPVTLAMMREQLAFGSGFGSFDQMYRAIEPSELLSLRYLNHVHNDYIELGIEAGLPGLIVLAAALAWFVARLVTCFQPSASDLGASDPSAATFAESFERRIAQAAAGVALIVTLASITDYPVRTPIWMMVLAICAVWLTGTRRAAITEKRWIIGA